MQVTKPSKTKENIDKKENKHIKHSIARLSLLTVLPFKTIKKHGCTSIQYTVIFGRLHMAQQKKHATRFQEEAKIGFERKIQELCYF